MTSRGSRIATLAIGLALAAGGAATASVVTERWGGHVSADHTGDPRDVSPAENFPTWSGEPYVRFGNANGGHRLALLYFDVSELDSATVVRSARLRLPVYAYAVVGDGWEPVHEVLDPDGYGVFSETEATFVARRSGVPWSDTPPGDLATAIGSELDRAFVGNVPQYAQRWLEWDVTAAVRRWVAEPATNSGLVLPYLAGGLYGCDGHDGADATLRPYLEITYEGTDPDPPPQISWAAADHRHGQTFLTWGEIGATGEVAYRVYRHSAPISQTSLDDAEQLAELPPGSGAYPREAEGCYGGGDCSPIGQTRFVIVDDGPPLADDTGLLVLTAHDPGPVERYYAVTSVVEGDENRDELAANTVGPITETAAAPRPVRVWTNDTGTGWVYTQFMDFERWNRAIEGYAANFYVGVPADYAANPATEYPLLVQLHAWGGTYRLPASPGSGGTDYGWPAIWVTPDDRTLTWWFGFGAAAGHLDEPLDSAPVVDYTHQRLDAMLAFLGSELRVDDARIYLWGGSMGGSGALNYGLRRGDLFAAIYAESAMTDFARAGDAGGTAWEDGAITALWGTTGQDLPTNLGMSIWQWYDLQQWVAANPGAELPFLADHHGSGDDVIDWETQGLPWYGAVEAGDHGLVGVFDGSSHSWPGFVANSAMFTLTDFVVRRDESFPGLANASSSDDPAAGPGCRNCRLEWSASWHDFAGPPVDDTDHYAIVLRTADGGDATVDVTPRRRQAFRPPPGTVLDWANLAPGGPAVQQGTVTVDGDGLFTITSFAVGTVGNTFTVTPVAGPDLPFSDGFESGDTSVWSAVVPG